MASPTPEGWTPTTLESEWDEFNRMAVPHDASETLRLDMRLSFYAGARVMLRLMHECSDLADADADAQIEVIQMELDGWKAAVLEEFNKPGGDLGPHVFNRRHS